MNVLEADVTNLVARQQFINVPWESLDDEEKRGS